jgi:hypothetical protein
MKLKAKLLVAASMLPIMANAYYMNSTACASQSVYVSPMANTQVIYSDGVNAPVVETVNYNPVYVPVMVQAPKPQPQPQVNYAPVSNYNTQQYYTPVVQTTVGYYQ